MRASIVVVGGGHAGCEAAAASASMGVDTLLVTAEPEGLCKMSCNPAIGGVGKGQLVREIDALGGLMGRLADSAAIQYKVLNRKKGPAVWGLRAQEDRSKYAEAAGATLAEVPGLRIEKGNATGLMISGGRIRAVITDSLGEIEAEAVIIAAGTFLGGLIHRGSDISSGGRLGEAAAHGITETLVEAGLRAKRFKTGTPPRVDGKSLDYSRCREEWGDETPIPFSSFGTASTLPRRACWLTGTTGKTHALIRANIDRAPLFTGQIHATGPRSCPSVEDKVMRFSGRETHQVYIEPEGLNTDEVYLNGLSTSLPADVQERMVATVPGLEEARITQYGYAIEYDYFPPQQLKSSLETKKIKRLYLAGQINGTTGYEEAGALGLMAGINAALAVKGDPPVVLERTRAYIGVLVDDLVTRGVDYPYRVYTSRAEARLMLRNDNADLRLSGLGRALGVLDEERYRRVEEKKRQIETLRRKLALTSWSRDRLDEVVGKTHNERFRTSQKLEVVLRRPGVTLETLMKGGLRDEVGPVRESAAREAELLVKYEGYVRRGEMEAKRLQEAERIVIPDDLDYLSLQNVTIVAREKLNDVRPVSLGQASRIPGVTPNDLGVLAIVIEKMRRTGRG